MQEQEAPTLVKMKGSSGNAFRRLGHRVDLRDTFNRRCDQERSHQSAAQNRQPVVASRGQGRILVEDLHYVIATMKEHDMELIAGASGSPFSQEVCEARLLKGFKLSTIKVYDKKYDPQTILTISMISWNYTWFQNWQNAEFLLSP